MKRSLEDLVLFGGPAAFLQPAVVGRPSTGDPERLRERLDGVIKRGWLTNGGPLVREFEQRVAEAAEADHAVATTNATAGLSLVIRALELTGEIIMPSLTFPATPQSVSWLGLEPVLCDVDLMTGCLAADAVEAAITPRTSAILGVHLWGRPGDIAALERIAETHQLPLIFDAAHAFGCSYQGESIGHFGRAEVFSFHATKVVNAFEGGVVTTNDAELAKILRSMQNFGLDSDRLVTSTGTNAKMNEASAAMGLTSLDAYEDVMAHNRSNYACYRELLSQVPGLDLIHFDAEERNNYQYVIAVLDPDHSGLGPNTLMKVLAMERILTQRYFHPGCHQMAPFQVDPPLRLPHTEWYSERVLALPTGPAMTGEDVRRVCNVIEVAVAHAAEVSIALERLG